MSLARKNASRLKLLRRAGVDINGRFVVTELVLRDPEGVLAQHLTGVRDLMRRRTQLDSLYVGRLARDIRADLEVRGLRVDLRARVSARRARNYRSFEEHDRGLSVRRLQRGSA